MFVRKRQVSRRAMESMSKLLVRENAWHCFFAHSCLYTAVFILCTLTHHPASAVLLLSHEAVSACVSFAAFTPHISPCLFSAFFLLLFTIIDKTGYFTYRCQRRIFPSSWHQFTWFFGSISATFLIRLIQIIRCPLFIARKIDNFMRFGHEIFLY